MRLHNFFININGVNFVSYNLVKYGKVRERRNYSKVKSNIELPDLIKVQTESFQWFVDRGLIELFRDISPIQNFTENIELYFEDYEFGEELIIKSKMLHTLNLYE